MALTAHTCFWTFTCVNLSKLSSFSILEEKCYQPGWDCNLKNFPLTQEMADHWLEISESLCLGCLPLEQRSTWLDPPLGKEGEKSLKKDLFWTQSSGWWSKRWKSRVYLFSLCAYNSVWTRKLLFVLLTRLQIEPGRSDQVTDQSSKHPDTLTFPGSIWLLSYPASGPLVFKRNGTNVPVSWPSQVRGKWLFRLFLVKLGFLSSLYH